MNCYPVAIFFKICLPERMFYTPWDHVGGTDLLVSEQPAGQISGECGHWPAVLQYSPGTCAATRSERFIDCFSGVHANALCSFVRKVLWRSPCRRYLSSFLLPSLSPSGSFLWFSTCAFVAFYRSFLANVVIILCHTQLLRIRDPLPFWPLHPGWVFFRIPDPKLIFLRAW